MKTIVLQMVLCLVSLVGVSTIPESDARFVLTLAVGVLVALTIRAVVGYQGKGAEA